MVSKTVTKTVCVSFCYQQHTRFVLCSMSSNASVNYSLIIALLNSYTVATI